MYPGIPIGGGKAGLSQLKASLKDPTFVKKMREVEDKRMQFYMKILKNRGQVIKREDGGQAIVSIPEARFYFL